MRDYMIETDFEMSREIAQDIASGLQELLFLSVSAIAIDSHTWAIRVHGATDSDQDAAAQGYLAGVKLMLREIA